MKQNETYKTRDDRTATIVTVGSSRRNYPVTAEVDGELLSLTLDGRFNRHVSAPHNNDLMVSKDET